MREFYTTEEATQNSFLFISYSHEDQEIVKSWAEYLLNQGVLFWWDKAFLGGDDWETIAMKLLSHENCRGILFFGSENSIKSPNVAKEWRTAARTKEGRPEGDFYAQIIMVAEDSTVNYKYLTNYVKKTEELFSDDDYDDFRNLFGKRDHVYFLADQESEKERLLDTIKKRASQTIDETAIIRDKLADISNLDKELVLKLGTYGDDRKPLLWHQVQQGEKTATLLCQKILAEELGGKQADEWLKNFIQQAFSSEEQEVLQGKVRLLTQEEATTMAEESLTADRLWWLAECDGNLQAVVREDGTVYQHGYNNKLYKKGIRPVITLEITTLYSLVKK